MSLLDKSPGAIISLAIAVVNGVIQAETWMLTTASMAALTAVMALIIVTAGLMARGIMSLMGSEEYSLGEPERVPAPAPAPVATARRQPTPRFVAQH